MEEDPTETELMDLIEEFVRSGDADTERVPHTSGCTRMYVSVGDKRFRIDVTECGFDDGI